MLGLCGVLDGVLNARAGSHAESPGGFFHSPASLCQESMPSAYALWSTPRDAGWAASVAIP